jgi:hypothetical protein
MTEGQTHPKNKLDMLLRTKIIEDTPGPLAVVTSYFS